MAKTILFLDERNLRSISRLSSAAAEKAAARDELLASIKVSEARLAEIATLRKHIINYSKTRSTYEEYRKAGYVVYEDEEPIAHIFLKGCIKEDYTSFFDTAGYIPFTGNGVLKVNLCVIQNHENDEKEGIHTQMSQADQTRELHPHLCRRPAAGGV